MGTIPVFAVLVVAICIAATPTNTTALPDAWTPIPDAEIKDAEIQAIGSWAVTEHVKQANDGITFSRVVSGQIRKQYTGVNYRLIIDASDRSGKVAKYEAMLWDKQFRGSRLLVYFKHVK